MKDTVGVNLEGDFDLGDATWCRWDSGEVEFSKKMVILGHRALTLVDLDGDGVLVVRGSVEDLRLLGGDDGVSGDELGHDSTNGFNTHGKRVDIKKNDGVSVLFTGQDSGLNGGTVSDSLVRVDTSGWLLATEELLNELLNFGNTSGTSDEHDLVDVLLAHVSIFKNLLHGLHGASE